MTTWGLWVSYLCVAAIPGLFNILVAFGELAQQCRDLPFFEPAKSSGVWLWAVVQFSFPAIIFWFVADLPAQPEINAGLFVQAIGFGFGFVAVLNARIDIATESLNVKGLYSFFVKMAYTQIAQQQTGRAAQFWQDLEQTLLPPSPEQGVNLDRGCRYLDNYFRSDISLSPEEKARYRERLSNLNDKTEINAKVEGVVDLVREVRRQHLTIALTELGCDRAFIQRYFKPSQIPSSKPQSLP